MFLILSRLKHVINKWSEEHKDDYIEVLVNNAGIRKDMLLMWMENNHWQDVIEHQSQWILLCNPGAA